MRDKQLPDLEREASKANANSRKKKVWDGAWRTEMLTTADSEARAPAGRKQASEQAADAGGRWSRSSRAGRRRRVQSSRRRNGDETTRFFFFFSFFFLFFFRNQRESGWSCTIKTRLMPDGICAGYCNPLSTPSQINKN